jgi:signal transduction histidine kinase
VEIELPDNLPVINTERMKLQQVFLNLISNSIKYNDKENVLIKIACIEEQEYYTFSVEDNGPGIEERYHEKVFIIFQTLQARDTFESTGVGLAIVKKIIDETGGEIWIESELGLFTRFLFKWPKKSSASFKSVQSPVEKSNVISAVALN